MPARTRERTRASPTRPSLVRRGPGSSPGIGFLRPLFQARSLGEELLLQSYEGAFERTPDRAREQYTVEQASYPAPRLVLDDEPVDESVTVRLEVALVVCVGQAGLRARVGHDPV